MPSPPPPSSPRDPRLPRGRRRRCGLARLACTTWLLTSLLAACSSTPEEEALDTMQEAILVAREGDLERGAELLEQAHEERPGFVDPLMFLANVHERRGDLPAARRAYERVLHIDPTLSQAVVALALTYLSENDVSAAQLWLERALQGDPGFEPTLFNLGLLAERRQRPDEAGAWYRLCATLDRRSSRALARQAALALQAGHMEAARDLARRALERRPDDPTAAAVMQATDGR